MQIFDRMSSRHKHIFCVVVKQSVKSPSHACSVMCSTYCVHCKFSREKKNILLSCAVLYVSSRYTQSNCTHSTIKYRKQKSTTITFCLRSFFFLFSFACPLRVCLCVQYCAEVVTGSRYFCSMQTMQCTCMSTKAYKIRHLGV